MVIPRTALYRRLIDRCIPLGTMSTLVDCKNATRRIYFLLGRTVIRRQEVKGEWLGTKRLEHLGVMVYSSSMRFSVTAEKADHVNHLAPSMLRDVRVSQ